jgi:hypothetical protein
MIAWASGVWRAISSSVISSDIPFMLGKSRCAARPSSRSRAEGDKCIVPENHGERQEGQHFMGNDQEATWRVFLY